MPKYEDEGIVEDNDDLETEEGGMNPALLFRIFTASTKSTFSTFTR